MTELNEIRGTYFDTTTSLVCNVESAYLTEALARCGTYEQQLSRFVAGSDVWRINHAEGHPVEVGSETISLLTCAEQVRQTSEGAFNIAVGSIAELWDFSGATPQVPSADVLQQARERMERAVIVIEGNRVQVPAGTVIDLGGIAKGYICDRIADYLRSVGASSGILNFGGNVTTIGQHPDGRPWQVGLQSPTAQREEAVFAVVESSDTAVVTSGVYERAFVFEDTLYHHLIDPRTCYPADLDIVSATVIAEDGMLADALATALLIMGAEAGLALLESSGVKGVVRTVKGVVYATPGLAFKLVAPE